MTAKSRTFAKLSPAFHRDIVLEAVADIHGPVAVAYFAVLIAKCKDASHHVDNPDGWITTNLASFARECYDTPESAGLEYGAWHDRRVALWGALVDAELVTLQGSIEFRCEVRLTNFTKWQHPKGSSADRVEKHRHGHPRAGETPSDVTPVKQPVTGGNEVETHTETETETETKGQTHTSDKPGSDQLLVFEHWKYVFGKTDRTVFGPKRRRVVAKAIKSHGIERVLRSLDGWKLDPWEDRKRHDDLTVLLRDEAKIEQGEAFLIDTTAPGASPKHAPRKVWNQ